MNPRRRSAATTPSRATTRATNAPLTVLTLDRVVSLRDYEDFARAFAGIAKALATWSWDGERRGVFVTVAGPARRAGRRRRSSDAPDGRDPQAGRPVRPAARSRATGRPRSRPRSSSRSTPLRAGDGRAARRRRASATALRVRARGPSASRSRSARSSRRSQAVRGRRRGRRRRARPHGRRRRQRARSSRCPRPLPEADALGATAGRRAAHARPGPDRARRDAMSFDAPAALRAAAGHLPRARRRGRGRPRTRCAR